jgi:hypothetical protein
MFGAHANQNPLKGQKKDEFKTKFKGMNRFENATYVVVKNG